MRVLALTPVLAILLTGVRPATAHEMRPSLLELRPEPDGKVRITFRVAYARNRPQELEARFPAHCVEVGAPEVIDRPPVRTRSWTIDCKGGGSSEGEPSGLTGQLSVLGLGRYGTEVIVRDPERTVVLRPGAASMPLAPANNAQDSTRAALFTTYVRIGVEHILLGPDHLLFVLGLVLLVGWRTRQLVATTSAFTVAHSVTLALATLDFIQPPSRAVEAIIAASIVALAVELAKRGQRTLVSHTPWVFALVCGLLHGFGFAGVLAEVGLPAQEAPLALLGFNLGVELGQLAFVAVALAAGLLAMRLRLQRARIILVYGMGCVGAFWMEQRTLPILLYHLG